MNEAERVALERRLLILAPTGRDAPLARGVLAETGVRCVACTDLGQLMHELERGAGALLVAEEAIGGPSELYALGERLARQATWSDLPILLLAHTGADSPLVRQAVRAMGNVTLLERPVRVAALMTAVQTALRARGRQYNAREHLTDLDHIARALRESEGRLKAIFANAAVGIAELDAEGRFALANDSLCRLLGETVERLRTLSLAEIAHEDDREDVSAVLRSLVHGEEETYVGERRFLGRGGATIWLKLALALARDESGAPRVAAVIEDVTERKNAEEDLREADRRKDEFLATLAHELRNPLAPIRNSLHIFRLAGVQDPTVVRMADMMERQVGHMVRMVDDLLEVSRISRGKIELRKQRVELAEVLANAVETSMPLIEAAGHRLTVEMSEMPLAVDADPLRLAQVFANLLNNSAKYTPKGGEISVRVQHEGAQAVIRVKDNGEGIPAPMLGRVFNMFTQVNTGMRAQGGLGIGLTLARTLLHLHGGTIEGKSEGSGQGSEFVVRLPLAAAEVAVNEAPEAVAMPVASGMRRVLVVDDNEDAADTCATLLEMSGYEVRVVYTPEDAIAVFAQFDPGVAILDIGLPGQNGYELARAMRRLGYAGRLVALTGYGQSADMAASTAAGFDAHLTKPVVPSELLERVARFAAEFATFRV